MDDNYGKSGEGSAPVITAVYHEVDPKKVLVTRVYIGLTVVMILISLICCLVKGKEDFTFYLMGVNNLISALTVVFVCFWYKTGDLDPSKWWFLIVLGTVVIFQCIVTDIYVFNHAKPDASLTTAAPIPTGNLIPIIPATTVKAVFEAVIGGRPDY